MLSGEKEFWRMNAVSGAGSMIWFSRYKLGDLVRVTGFGHEAPCLRFVGREGISADLFGEKLRGSVVEELIKASLAGLITARSEAGAPANSNDPLSITGQRTSTDLLRLGE